MIKAFYFNDLRTCCYVLHDETGECAIVDPGCYKQSEKDRLVKYVEQHSLMPKMILQTHGHFDHVMGNVFVSTRWNIPTFMSSADIPQLKRARSYAAYFGYDFEQPSEEVTDLQEGQSIHFGNTVLSVSASPGHTPGGVIFYNEKEKYVLTGDTLFKGSIGRTDLPGGDYDALMNSIRTRLLVLPGDTAVYPGHGPATDISDEILKNPFLE